MKEILIAGKRYPIEYTVEAQSKIAEKAGGLKKVGDVITNNPCFLIATMMTAAYHRNKIFADIDGREFDSVEPLTEDALSAVLLPPELNKLMPTVMEVMSEACKADVETVPDKVKKTKNSTRSE